MSRAGSLRVGGHNLGFSLIELIAAVAVLSVVSVMAVQALSVTVVQRRVLERIDRDTRSLSWALVLLRRDLQSALEIPFEPSFAPSQPAFDVGENRFALSISSHARVPGEAGVGLARVSWRFDPVSGALTRRITPLLQPRNIEIIGREHIFLSDVTALSIKEIGNAQLNEDAATSLPHGFEVKLGTVRYGVLNIRVAR